MVKRLIEFKSKVEEFIFDNATTLGYGFAFLAVFSYTIGVHTTILRDIVFIVSFILALDLAYMGGIVIMAKYIVQHPEALEDKDEE